MVDFNKLRLKNKMTTKTANANANANANETTNTTQAIAVKPSDSQTAISDAANYSPVEFNRESAELDAELKTALLALGVNEITAPSKIIDRGKFSMQNCFFFEITGDDGEPKDIIIYVVTMNDNGELLTVGQSKNAPRVKFVDAFQKATVAKKQLVITNLEFVKLEGKGKAGNPPLIIRNSAETKMSLSPLASN